MISKRVKIKKGTLPDAPGVYIMQNAAGKVIYVGKASSLKRRVTSYFQRPQDARIQKMVSEIAEVDYIQKPTAIEALILEANLIKYYWPKYNVLQKDDKSFMYLAITDEEFPKPLLVRGTQLDETSAKKYRAVFGPYTSSGSLRAALDLVRGAFPWSQCEPGQKRACFNVHLKLCPGVCINAIDKKEYSKTIRDLMRFFEGKRERILKQYTREMKKASKAKRFEEAALLRNKIYFLTHIQDVAILKREDNDAGRIRSGEGMPVNLFGRIEGYDISNISGTSQVASMVVFENGAPAKAEYRKFRIRTVAGADDIASVRETLMRRFRNSWRKPDLILIDGGLGQVRATEKILHELEILVPVVGIAKGPKRKRNDVVCSKVSIELCNSCKQYVALLVQVRDEAHRFAIKYHKALRAEKFLGGQ